MTVRRIHHDDVDARVDQGARANNGLRTCSDRRRHAQAAVLILVRVRKIAPLEDVLHGDETLEHAGFVNHRKLLDLVQGQNGFGRGEGGTDRRGDEPVARHRLGDRPFEIRFELEVAIGDDPDQPPGPVDDRNARDAEASHQRVGFANRSLRPERDRVHDHAALAALDPIHLGGLPIDRHILVEHTDSARPRHCDRHLRFGDGVHGGGDERDVERDTASEATGGEDVARMNARMPGNEQDVVEREAEPGPDMTHRWVRGSDELVTGNIHKRTGVARDGSRRLRLG